MITYLYTNDMRISNLQEKAEKYAHMFLLDNVPSGSENKSQNNSANSIGYYLNLILKGNCAHLIESGSFRDVIINFIKKFQFPNPRTKENLDEWLNSNKQIAPLREVIKLLLIASASEFDDVYLTQGEIKDFIFFNQEILNKSCDVDRVKLYQQIIDSRKNPTLIRDQIDTEVCWSNTDNEKRQLREMLGIFEWSGIVQYENEKYSLVNQDELTLSQCAELHNILIYNDYWDYSIQEKKLENYKESYFKYIDDIKKESLLYVKKEKDFISIPKPFLILAGISGTGKTRFVRKQAELIDPERKNYCLVSVRPDWHEPSDLLGYISRLSGKAEYVATDVIKFIVKAWSIIYSKLGKKAFNGDSTNIKIQALDGQLDNIPPYWLCLDEMNLAPVEQYFADYLSVLETRKWKRSVDQSYLIYECSPLLKPSVFDDLDISECQKALGIKDNELWEHFKKYGIAIPFNLIVAGTVNMDETTHGFSRKVLDRALSFDFGEFFPNNFNDYFKPKYTPKLLGYPRLTSAEGIDQSSEVNKSIEFLNEVNDVFANTPFQLAFRSLNELLLSVECFPITAQQDKDIVLQSIWDDFLMQKVLPRIEGDRDKLLFVGKDETLENDHLGKEKTILEQLEVVLKKQLDEIWDGVKRIDLYREHIDDVSQTVKIACRSKEKLNWMISQLDSADFTQFWQ